MRTLAAQLKRGKLAQLGLNLRRQRRQRSSVAAMPAPH